MKQMMNPGEASVFHMTGFGQPPQPIGEYNADLPFPPPLVPLQLTANVAGHTTLSTEYYGLVSNGTLLAGYIRSTGKVPHMLPEGVVGYVKVDLAVLRPLIAEFAAIQATSYDPHLIIAYGEDEPWPQCTRDVELRVERDILSREKGLCVVKAGSFLARTIRTNAQTLGVEEEAEGATSNRKSILVVGAATVDLIVSTWALAIDPKAVATSLISSSVPST